MSRAAIIGCAGTALSTAERELFSRLDPLGLILFARNIETPEQTRALVEAFRDSVGRADAPVLVDQEGGRVQRLGPPHWPRLPPMARCGALYAKNQSQGLRAATLQGRLIAASLISVGATVACAPVADRPARGADPIIGDRAPSEETDALIALARALAEGLVAGGVLPVLKHVPGHGRADADSHKALPTVHTARAILDATDFRPFRALADLPWAMTAHVRYTALDAEQPATTSPTVMRMIREDLGVEGLILSDDLDMKALGGTLAERAQACLAAGCDVALQCSGALEDTRAVLEVTPPLSAAAQARLAQGEALRTKLTEANVNALHADLMALLGS